MSVIGSARQTGPLTAARSGVDRDCRRLGQPEISSIDLNPVLVGAAGDGAVIVDALIERASQA